MPTDLSAHLRYKRVLATSLTKKFWIALALVPVAFLLAALWVAVFGWNWARAPLQREVQARTGRELVIAGDLHISLGWPLLRVQAQGLRFANPPWASEPQMLVADSADMSVELPALWRGRLVFPSVRLRQPVVMLELAADGRKTWLLDSGQRDESARVTVSQLVLDHGQLGFDDPALKTHVRVAVDTPADATGTLVFKATGRFKGQPLTAQGSGGPVLALRDERSPYPLQIEASVGPTHLRAEGQVTGLLTLAAVDLRVDLRGDSLASLFPLLGVGLPRTHNYVTAGHLVRQGTIWRYDKFSGRVGRSDVAGSLQVERAGPRPFLSGEVSSQRLDLDDLAPVVGARGTTVVGAARAAVRVLPDIPFNTERWRTFDADVTLHANTLLLAHAKPLGELNARIQMRDAVLSLQPLDFAAAGGHLNANIRLDARKGEIQGSAQIQARQLVLGELIPGLASPNSPKLRIGDMNGEFNLVGHGDSVGRMLATADGHGRLEMGAGVVSRLLMEQMGLHLLEILQLSISGDQAIALRCGLADFDFKQGVMTPRSLLLDTDVSTVTGSGRIDLAQETLDLTLVPHSRKLSVVALRSPIHVGGRFGAPMVSLDKQRILARGAGALALGLLNPVLALLPLVETGPGLGNECGHQLSSAPSAKDRKPAQAAAPVANRGRPASAAVP